MERIDCDRFQQCSANICPLDYEWQKRKHIKGERVCYYLIEAQKDGAKAIFEGLGRDYLYELMVTATLEITARHTPIKIALERAKETGSRINRVFGAKL